MAKICRVLVVENHSAVRALLGEALDQQGYRLRLVGSGAQMHEAMQEEPFDIVIIDVSLRGEDGFELARGAADQGCGVILTTADQRHFDAVQKSGHPFMLKPFQLPSLLRLVDEVVAALVQRCGKRQSAHRRHVGA
jgi:two-component system OmpR family response regulator